MKLLILTAAALLAIVLVVAAQPLPPQARAMRCGLRHQWWVLRAGQRPQRPGDPQAPGPAVCGWVDPERQRLPQAAPTLITVTYVTVISNARQ